MTQARNRLPLLLGLLGAGFIAYRFVANELEDYENKLGFTLKGFKPKWSITEPLSVTLEIYVDIRNDNRVGGQVLGFEGGIYWGENGAAIIPDLSVNPFELKANGHINKTTWIVTLPLLSVSQDVKEQIQAGDWQQLPWLKGDLLTSYGKVTGISTPMIKL